MEAEKDLCPFRHDEVLKSLPPIYYKTGDRENFTWLKTPPKDTIFRVNSIIGSPEVVLTLIKGQLEECGKLSKIYVHPRLPECLVIEPTERIEGVEDVSLPEIIVDVCCASAVLRGAHIFAPGVLGMPYISEGVEVNIYADLEGKCKRGFTQKFTHRKLFIGTGVTRLSRQKLFENNAILNGIAVEITKTTSGIPSFVVAQSLGILQNLPSVVVGHVLDPKPSHSVLDMCAAPGNKTTLIAALMQNKGQILALDKSEGKVRKIKELCSLMGVTNVVAKAMDSTQADEIGEKFDRILLDAPCSALGNRPHLMNKITPKELSSYPFLQKSLFCSAVNLLKEGGILVYSTCTITLTENENLVAWALDKFPRLTLCPAEPFLGSPGLPQSNLSEDQRSLVQRFAPNPKTDTVGFFIAKFQKT